MLFFKEGYQWFVISLYKEFSSENICRILTYAQVLVRASFSIWAYCCSVSVMALDAYAIGLHKESLFCISISPNPQLPCSL